MERVLGGGLRAWVWRAPGAGPVRRNAPGSAAPLLLIAAFGLLQGCALFRPSPQAQCRRANGLINRAVRICPESATLRTDTHTVVLPGDSATGGTPFLPADIDSINAACAQLAEALAAERDLYMANMGHASGLLMARQHQLDSLRSILTRNPEPATVPLSPSKRRQPATSAIAAGSLRAQLCRFDTIVDVSVAHDLRIWYTPQGPRHRLIIHPRAAIITTTTLPITAGPVKVDRPAPVWLIALAIVGWLTAIALYLLFRSERTLRARGIPPR